MPRRSLLRHPADRIPAFVVTCGVALAFIGYASALSGPALAVLWLVALALRSLAPVHQHCHAHKPLFRSRLANHGYDLVLMLAAGNLTAVWELQHVLGHHQHYLAEAGDPANIHRFGRIRHQRLVFTVLGDALSFTDSLAIAAGRPAQRKRLITQQVVQLGALALLIACDPARGLTFFLLPWVLLRWLVFWTSYAQHAGAPMTDVYSGSVTHFGLSNRFYLNVGHHTAHHERPGLHWTLLPARTAQILERIPSTCLPPPSPASPSTASVARWSRPMSRSVEPGPGTSAFTIPHSTGA